MIQLMLFFIAAITLLLGWLVYANSPKEATNRFYALFTVFSASWLMANALATSSSIVLTVSSSVQLLSAQLISLSVLLTIYFLYRFLLSYFNKSRKKLFLFSLFAADLFVAGLAFTGIGAYIDTQSGDIAVGNFYYIYLALLLLQVVMILGLLFVKDKKIEGSSSLKMQRIFLRNGLLLTVVPALVFGAVLPAFIDSSWVIDIAPLFSIIFISFAAWAIIKHSLFDIRPIVVRAVSYSVSLIIIAILFIFFTVYIGKDTFFEDLSTGTIIAATIIMVIFAVIFQPIKRYFDKVSNKLFYRNAYNPQEVINRINSKLVNAIHLDTLLGDTAQVIEQDLNVSYCDFYLDPKAPIHFHLAGTNQKLFTNAEWSNFVEAFTVAEAKIITENDSSLDTTLKNQMKLMHITAAIKMRASGEDVGFLIVGDRKSGSGFNTQDMQLLEIIADEVAIAVQNALRYETIEQFNLNLQKRIDEATAELQKTNEKLLSLDEAKDDFISMASHQLRTPLTSIKGYLSMIIEGDAGDINETQRKFLDQAYISSQRMVYLIADLLNVSRLKTGKFAIEPTEVYLPDVVQSEINQLQETAKSRGLELIIETPDEFPMVRLDETKTRQVIMNFVDNAIYYTPKGGKITVKLTKTKTTIEYNVTDTGIGVPKNEQHHLFNKFYRANNAKKARPDGTGLGLFMAKKVIIAQGGAILFKSQEGKGSTFGFRFPLERIKADEAVTD